MGCSSSQICRSMFSGTWSSRETGSAPWTSAHCFLPYLLSKVLTSVNALPELVSGRQVPPRPCWPTGDEAGLWPSASLVQPWGWFPGAATGGSLSAMGACACMLSHFSHVRLCATLWTVADQAPLSVGFSRQEYWRGLPCPPPGDLPNPGIKPASLMSPALQASSLPLVPPGKPHDGGPAAQF